MGLADRLCDPHARIVIAHRGNAVAHPENTLEALSDAVALGADALEFDVRMTSDGVPVLMHDPDLDRTTTGHGLLRTYTLADIRTIDVVFRGKGTAATKTARVPTLDEVLERFRETPLVVEVKEMGAAEAAERAIRRHGVHENVVVGSIDADVSAHFARTGLRTCASVLQAALVIPLAIAGMTPRHPAYDVLSITPRFHGIPVPIHAMVRAAGRASVATHVWTVNDEAQARGYWAAGVTGIITDDPGAMIRSRPR